eukprot:jgi/Tetstr1/453927/TSEL_040846.t1
MAMPGVIDFFEGEAAPNNSGTAQGRPDEAVVGGEAQQGVQVNQGPEIRADKDNRGWGGASRGRGGAGRGRGGAGRGRGGAGRAVGGRGGQQTGVDATAEGGSSPPDASAEASPEDAAAYDVPLTVFRTIVGVFFQVRGGNPTRGELFKLSGMIRRGEVDPLSRASIAQAVKEMVGDVSATTTGEDIASDNIRLDAAEWSFGRLGFTTISVPYALTFPADGPETSSTLRVTVKAPRRTTYVSVLNMGETPAAKRTTGPEDYEFTVTGDARGEIKLTQSDQQTSFALRFEFRGQVAERAYEAPQDTFPPDDASSANVVLGPVTRVNRRVRIPFEVLQRRPGVDKLRVAWKAPARSTYFNAVDLAGVMTPVESLPVSADTVDTPLIADVQRGVIEMQQIPGTLGAPAFTVWARYGDDVTAIRVERDDTPVPPSWGDHPTPPPHVTPVDDTRDHMVDLDAFPHRTRQPVHTQVVVATPRIEFGIATSERVSPRSTGHVLRLPFQLRFAPGEVPWDTILHVDGDMDPATTQFRGLHHDGENVSPTQGMLPATTFEARVPAPTRTPSVLTFDQPLGRRPIRVTLSYAGETASILLEGEHSRTRGAGLIGQKKPVDFDGKPQPRFTDVHESAEQRVKALYRSVTEAEPDEQTTKFLMSKYFEWDGDLARVSNLAETISAVVTADPDDDEAQAVQRAIAALDAGATPGQAREALRNWKEYETHRAMWRPDATRAGYPGATALKRPWANEAVLLSEGHSSDLPSVAHNLSADFDVAPGESPDLLGQGHWMFS